MNTITKKITKLLIVPTAITLFASADVCPPVNPPDRTVLLPNPANCTSFFECAYGVPILQYCPDGLHFNPELETCDWPESAGCEKKEGFYQVRLDYKKCTITTSTGKVLEGIVVTCESGGGLEKCVAGCEFSKQ